MTLTESASAPDPCSMDAVAESTRKTSQMSEIAEITEITEVIVCTTCRPAGATREAPSAGAALLEAVQIAQLQGGQGAFVNVRVRGMECLSSCSRACTVAFQAPGKGTYLFGDLVPDEETAQHVLLCAALHANASDGALLRNDRPARLRKGILAKLPPFGGNP